MVVIRPPRYPVPAGKTRLCVAGYVLSPFTGHSRGIAAAIATALPNKYETWYYFDGTVWRSENYFSFLKETFDPVPFPPHLKGHSTCPFIWTETAGVTTNATNEITPIGGDSHFTEWVKGQPELMAIESVKKQANASFLRGPFYLNWPGAPKATANVDPTTNPKRD